MTSYLVDQHVLDVAPDPDAGVSITVTSYRHATEEPAWSVVVWPGMGVPARHYQPLAAELVQQGATVGVVDLPGQGLSRSMLLRFRGLGYHALASECAPAVVEWARRAGDDRPLYHLGHSLGGHVALLHAARLPHDVDGIVLLASGTPFHRAFSGGRRGGYALGGLLMSAVPRVLGYWPGDVLGFGGKQSAALITEFGRTVLTGRFEPRGADLDYEAALTSLRLPVLAINVIGDAIAPRDAVERLCAKIPAAPVERHEFNAGAPLDHYRWVRHAEVLVPVIATWVHDQGEVDRPRPLGLSPDQEAVRCNVKPAPALRQVKQEVQP